MSRGPGRWQAEILAALEERPWFSLAAYFTRKLGRHLTRAEHSALHRAAHALKSRGTIALAAVFIEPADGIRHVSTVVGRPGVTIDGEALESLSVERVPHGTRST